MKKSLMYCLILSSSILSVSGQPQFTDVTEASGIDHFFYVFDGTFGGGAAVLDYNLDGFEDIFVTGGNGNNRLYKNNGDATFDDVSIQAELSVLDDKVTQGAVAADVNKDGYPDLYVTTIVSIGGENFEESTDVLLINDGDGSFTDKSEDYGLTLKTFSSGASFGDVNKDGFPDLFVTRYFNNFEGRLDQFGGTVLGDTNGPAGDLLYINNHGVSFIESSEDYGIDHVGLGFQGIWTDIDNDRDLDLLIANDFGSRGHPNYLYRNEYPVSSFTEMGADMNFDYGINAMGIGVGDYNMDGWMDYFVTNIQRSLFFVNQGRSKPFAEMTNELGTSFFIVYTSEGSGVPPVSWGVNFFDADLDMDPDIYISNGCLNPSLAPNPNLFLENLNGQYSEAGFITNTNEHSIGRGSITLDYDNDGDLDLFVVNQIPHQDQDVGVEFIGSRLFRNDNSSGNWLKVKLDGKDSDTNGIGSRVEVYVDSMLMIREIDGGSSHESQNSTIAHFGLADYEKADSVIIKWSKFGSQVLYDISANQLITVAEDVALSINEEERLLFTLFPNPTRGNVTVILPYGAIDLKSIDVYDISGRELYELPQSNIKVQDNAYELFLDHSMPEGAYILRVLTEDNMYSSRIIKIK